MTSIEAGFTRRQASRERWRPIATVLRDPRRAAAWMAAVAVIATALTVARRPEVVFHAQFWAEDGVRWYADAYNLGWIQATLTPVGYFHTVDRMTAALSMLVGLGHAPLLFNVVAIGVQVLPAVFIVSPRFSRVIPDFRIRLLLAFLYIALPNSFEVEGNISNAMTHLALLAAMIILAQPSRRVGWRAFDAFFVVLAGLSGPFVVALAPMAFVRWMVDRRSSWHLVLLLLLVGCTLVQGPVILLQGNAGRPHGPLGVSLHGFIAIVAGNVIVGAVIGLFHYTEIFTQPWWEPHALPVLITFLAGMALFAYAALRGPLELRLFIVFAWIVLVASLLTPVVSLTEPQWPLLADPGAGNRYYVLPMLALLASAVWLLTTRRNVFLRAAAGLVLAVTVAVGIPGDWTYPPYTNMQPELYAASFEAAPPGARVKIPINPPGWTIDLTKK